MGLTIGAIIELLNNLKLTQQSMDWMEDLPDEVWKNVLEGKCKELCHWLDVDKRRWYETSISVYAIADGIFGVRKVSDLSSEQMTVGDVYRTLEFFEMEEVKTITYKKK